MLPCSCMTDSYSRSSSHTSRPRRIVRLRSTPVDEFQLLAQGRQSADCIALESVGQIVREVPPVRDLQRTRCATALGARVHAISVAADHLASRMLIQPLNECI